MVSHGLISTYRAKYYIYIYNVTHNNIWEISIRWISVAVVVDVNYTINLLWAHELYEWHYCSLCYQFYVWCSFPDNVIKWKHFPRYWPLVRGIHRSPVNSPHKCQWRRALMFSLICARINGWVNNDEASELRRHRAHYEVIVMPWRKLHDAD